MGMRRCLILDKDLLKNYSLIKAEILCQLLITAFWGTSLERYV
jgi:hypothetical protein